MPSVTWCIRLLQWYERGHGGDLERSHLPWGREDPSQSIFSMRRFSFEAIGRSEAFGDPRPCRIPFAATNWKMDFLNPRQDPLLPPPRYLPG